MAVSATAQALSDGQKAFANQQWHEAVSQYQKVLQTPVEASSDEQLLRDKEAAIIGLGRSYAKLKDPQALAQVVRDSREFTTKLAKAKTAKLVRTLIDCFDDMPSTSGGVSAAALQIDTTKDVVQWARQSARIFLAQSLETRLVGLNIESGNYKEALNLINNLLRELKRLDDKMILTEVHLLESRVHHALSNLTRAKAAQTSARTAANAIYCPPLLQAGLDMQSGVLLAEEKDYKTGFSYFFEALEGFSSQDDKRAVSALKYMLLCKIMLSLSDDVATITAGKVASRYAGRDIDAMKAVAAASSSRSLSSFEKALQDFKPELTDDPIIRNHLGSLYDSLMESNLVKIIEPYSVVQIDYVAQQVGQPKIEVEKKLGQMILDKVFYGILDQGNGCLMVYDEPEEDKTYDQALEVLSVTGQVVDSLYQKATKLA